MYLLNDVLRPWICFIQGHAFNWSTRRLLFSFSYIYPEHISQGFFFFSQCYKQSLGYISCLRDNNILWLKGLRDCHEGICYAGIIYGCLLLHYPLLQNHEMDLFRLLVGPSLQSCLSMPLSKGKFLVTKRSLVSSCLLL